MKVRTACQLSGMTFLYKYFQRKAREVRLISKIFQPSETNQYCKTLEIEQSLRIEKRGILRVKKWVLGLGAPKLRFGSAQ